MVESLKYLKISGFTQYGRERLVTDSANHRHSAIMTSWAGFVVVSFQQALAVCVVTGLLAVALVARPDLFLESVAFLGVFFRLAHVF